MKKIILLSLIVCLSRFAFSQAVGFNSFVTGLPSGTYSGSVLAGVQGGVSKQFPSSLFAPVASPTITGTLTFPSPFTLGATSVTTTGTQFNYLNAATGTTGTTSSNLVFSTSPSFTTPILGAPQSADFSTGTFTWPTFNQNTTGSAAKWTTPRTFAITGDITYSQSVDGSANITGAGTLATVNSNVGSFTNANITVNGKGLITAASNGSTGTVIDPTTTDGDFIMRLSGSLVRFPDVASGNVMLAAGVGAGWTTGKVGLSTHVSGLLPETMGGTGQNSFVIGDQFQANSSTTLTLTSAVAIGNAWISGGVATASSWGKITSAHVDNTIQANVSAVTPLTTGAMNVTLSNVRSQYTITPTGNCTFNLISGSVAGAYFTFLVTTSGTSSFTLTWGTNFVTTGTLATGTVSGKIFTVTFQGDGTKYIEVSRTTAM